LRITEIRKEESIRSTSKTEVRERPSSELKETKKKEEGRLAWELAKKKLAKYIRVAVL
jgi:hypothetical protein